ECGHNCDFADIDHEIKSAFSEFSRSIFEQIPPPRKLLVRAYVRTRFTRQDRTIFSRVRRLISLKIPATTLELLIQRPYTDRQKGRGSRVRACTNSIPLPASIARSSGGQVFTVP